MYNVNIFEYYSCQTYISLYMFVWVDMFERPGDFSPDMNDIVWDIHLSTVSLSQFIHIAGLNPLSIV